ncbi:MAG: saccharopine dehydrogenase family protein [Bacteroidia bacterium]
MHRVMIIGAGAVAKVTNCKLHQMADIFSEVIIASRTLSKAQTLAQKWVKGKALAEKVNADDKDAVAALLRKYKPKLVINLALPYQDLPIMEACLQEKIHYLDTASYEPPNQPLYQYSYQWKYGPHYEQAGIMGLLGIGFDPGVTNAFVAYAQKHYFDEIHYLDIVDVNAGDHGHPFATNFNLEINLREITQPGRYWENGQWHITPPHSLRKEVNLPGIGSMPTYLVYHEELESLVKFFPTLKRARFWMGFSDNYLTHLRVLQNVGLTRIDPVDYEGHSVVPLKFLQRLIPDPATLTQSYKGPVSIGTQLRGIKEGKERTLYIYTTLLHEDAYQDCDSQAVAYTAGVPPALAARLILEGTWLRPGVWNVEQLDPDPLMELLPRFGLPWKAEVDYPIDFPA